MNTVREWRECPSCGFAKFMADDAVVCGPCSDSDSMADALRRNDAAYARIRHTTWLASPPPPLPESEMETR